MHATRTTPAATYAGVFTSPASTRLMRAGNILAARQAPEELVDRIADAVSGLDARWSSGAEAAALAAGFVSRMEAGVCTLGSPALTHIARGYETRSLTSCSAGPPDGPRDLSVIEAIYGANMGAGYNLDAVEDPSAALRELDRHATTFETEVRPERYVGYIAHVSAAHRRAREFIWAKAHSPAPLSRFNISVDFSADDIASLDDHDSPAAATLDDVAHAAWACGDPGVISLDRFNQANPLRDTSPYRTVAPCAEIGLAPDDTCVFAYISLPALLTGPAPEDLDVGELRRVVRMLVRVLDGMVEHSGSTLPRADGRAAALSRRRIAIGICGFADALLWLGIPYRSSAAQSLLEDVLSVVAYEAMWASHELALRRGSCTAARDGVAPVPTRSPTATGLVSAADWRDLLGRIAATGALRHSTRTALPPAGRSARLLGVTPSIEPVFGQPADAVSHGPLLDWLRCRAADGEIVEGALDIPWRRHLSVAQAASRFVDESLSKTVNLPRSATPSDVRDVMHTALAGGLKAISVYRQPTAS